MTDHELDQHRRVLVYRHLAWVTALRHAMRQPRVWEVFSDNRTNREWEERIHIPERESTLKQDLIPLVSEAEAAEALQAANPATALLGMQSAHLSKLKQDGLVWEFSFLDMEELLRELVTLQGQSERIKNFPYPRQYATLGYDFVKVFVLLLPLGVVPEFARMGQSLADDYPAIAPYFVWAAVPFTAVVAWVFHTMQRIGTVGENPFEGSANDVPISALARTIEIDLRQQLGEAEESLPPAAEPVHGVLM